MSEQELTARTIMERAADAFRPERAPGLSGVVQYVLTGDGGGEWYMTVAEGACQVTEGRAAAPVAIVTMAARAYIDLVTGKLNPLAAFMTGKIKLVGDVGLVTRLAACFEIS